MNLFEAKLVNVLRGKFKDEFSGLLEQDANQSDPDSVR
ncbi:hypothetical protein VRK_10540 [Vibrio sp. MEBiC08052]|nr:hypothetical protein VRK_10540 [Vibrio sp. MEBiC08052]